MLKTEVTAIIALGANLNQPVTQIQSALTALTAQPEIDIIKISPFFCTKPVGYTDQPDFVNAVAMLTTSLTALELLQILHTIENQFGRIRSFKNAPRTLDLDIIDYDHQIWDTDHLQLPHPRAHERAFVMVPLAAIAPDYTISHHGTAAMLADQIRHNDTDQLVIELKDVHWHS